MSKTVSFMLLGVVIGLGFGLCMFIPANIKIKSNYEKSLHTSDSLRMLADSAMARFAAYDSIIAEATKVDSTIKQYFNEQKISDYTISNDSLRSLLSK